MKILLTGAAGFIGMHVAQILLKRGDEVRRHRQPQRLLRPGVEARAAGTAEALPQLPLPQGRHFRPHGDGGPVRERPLRRRHQPRRAGRRALLAEESARLRAVQHRRLRQPARRLPPPRRQALRLRQLVQRLRRQHQDSVLHPRPGQPPGQPVRRQQEGQRADGAHLLAPLRPAHHRPALLHRLRPVGPARHVAVAVHLAPSWKAAPSTSSTTAT